MSDDTFLTAVSFLPSLPRQHTTPNIFKSCDLALMTPIDLIHLVLENVYAPTKDGTSSHIVKVECSLDSEHPSNTPSRLSPSLEIQEETNLDVVTMIRMPESDNMLGVQDLFASFRPISIPLGHILSNTDHYTDEPISHRLGFVSRSYSMTATPNQIPRLSEPIRSRTSTGTSNKRTSKASKAKLKDPRPA